MSPRIVFLSLLFMPVLFLLAACSGSQPRTVAIVDSDGDGIIDGLDRCPGSVAGGRVDSYGCSDDADRDGVFDRLDHCPGTPAGTPVDLAGCARDSDGVGVADGQDHSAETGPGRNVVTDGSPRHAADTSKPNPRQTTARLELDLHFATGTCRLLSGNEKELARGESFIRRHPAAQVVVEGHTDSVGPADYNVTLSLQRAKRVAWLLCQKLGRSMDHFEVVGYGESRPVADNATQAGRERNRRVVIRLIETQ